MNKQIKRKRITGLKVLKHQMLQWNLSVFKIEIKNLFAFASD